MLFCYFFTIFLHFINFVMCIDFISVSAVILVVFCMVLKKFILFFVTKFLHLRYSY